MSTCTNPNHPKFSAGVIDLCLVCDFRTDESFAKWSQALLKQVRDLEAKQKETL